MTKFTIIGKNKEKWVHYIEKENLCDIYELDLPKQIDELKTDFVIILPLITSYDIEYFNYLKDRKDLIILYFLNNINKNHIEEITDLKSKEFTFEEDWLIIEIDFNGKKLEIPAYGNIKKAPLKPIPILKVQNKTITLQIDNLIFTSIFPNEILLSINGAEFVNYILNFLSQYSTTTSTIADEIELIFSEGQDRQLIEASIFAMLFSYSDSMKSFKLPYEDIKHIVEIDLKNGRKFLDLLLRHDLIEFDQKKLDIIIINVNKFNEFKKSVLENTEKYPLLISQLD